MRSCDMHGAEGAPEAEYQVTVVRDKDEHVVALDLCHKCVENLVKGRTFTPVKPKRNRWQSVTSS